MGAARTAWGWTPSGLTGRGLGWAGSTLEGWGDAAARAGHPALGADLLNGGGRLHALGGLNDPVGSLLGLGQNSLAVGERDGAGAGWDYFSGSLYGRTQYREMYHGVDILTGEPLDGWERAGRFFAGFSASANAAAMVAGTVPGANVRLGGGRGGAGAAGQASGSRVAAVEAEAANSVATPRTQGVFNPADWADQVGAIRTASSQGVPAGAVMSADASQIASGIAGRFGNLECLPCANAVEAALTNAGAEGLQIRLDFLRTRHGYVESVSTGQTISWGGNHIGTMVGNKVYCNVHPGGLPFPEWVQDFRGAADFGRGPVPAVRISGKLVGSGR